ncbi:MAG TPA: SMC-Scp complex subunit ScpB [Polyangiaceae bacterium]|nr:SMC-Scp complex subunit ScpB [Polyangiaceae bacterium]
MTAESRKGGRRAKDEGGREEQAGLEGQEGQEQEGQEKPEPAPEEATPENVDVDLDVVVDGDEAETQDSTASFEDAETLDLSNELFASDDADADAESLEGPDEPLGDVSREHLKGLLEALVFASDKPLKASELAKLASAPLKEVKLLLGVLKEEYGPRGLKLDEVAGGFLFRTDPAYAPFVRDMTKQKPVKLTRAQIETLAILAYRQPITRPEIDEIRGVDCGAVLKLLLDRDLIRILGKKDEPGRPLLYGTTPQFLEFFGLKSLKDLPTLREFTELNEESRRVVERELGEILEGTAPPPSAPPPSGGEDASLPDDEPLDHSSSAGSE